MFNFYKYSDFTNNPHFLHKTDFEVMQTEYVYLNILACSNDFITFCNYLTKQF